MNEYNKHILKVNMLLKKESCQYRRLYDKVKHNIRPIDLLYIYKNNIKTPLLTKKYI